MSFPRKRAFLASVTTFKGTLSTGIGDHGEIDARGPWNQGGDWKYVEASAFADMKATERKPKGSANSGAVKRRVTK